MKRTVEAFQSFINPFHLEMSQPPTTLSLGAAMPEEVRHDVLNSLKDGKAKKEVFIRDRLLTKTIPFFDPIKRNKFKLMASTAPEQKLIASNQKVIFVKSQVLGLQVSISDLMTYPLTLTPYSMATIDGFFAKTNKAQEMNYLIKDAVNAYALRTDIHLLLEHWSSPFIVEEIVRRPIIFIKGGQAFKLACLDGLTSVEHLPEICSSHEETDVRIIIYIDDIQTTVSHIKTIRVRAKDSDIFILLYFTKSFTVDILVDTGMKLINISHLADNYSPRTHLSSVGIACLHWC